jgi:cbb3-type cytochrome oxidase maturation protein
MLRMDIIFLLIPLSLLLALVIVAALWWAVESGQFDDLEGPASRILMDDEPGGGEELRDGGRPHGERRGEGRGGEPL